MGWYHKGCTGNEFVHGCVEQGQPALLYLIPCTLGLVLALSYFRGDLAAMWDKEKEEDCAGVVKGRLPSIREEDEEEDSADIERGLLRAP